MIKEKNIELIILSICHLLVDAICISTLFKYSDDASLFITYICIYNTLAFTSQCIIGFLPDKFGHSELFISLSSFLLLIGAFFPIPFIIKIIFLGLGNSLFHVSGGYLVLKHNDKIKQLGMFVAPGALGLFIGKVFPIIVIPFICLLLCLSLFLIYYNKDKNYITKTIIPQTINTEYTKAFYACLLLIAIATRALGGNIIEFSFKTTVITSLVITIAVFLGKFSGGFIADKFNINTVAIWSILIASIILIFSSNSLILSLIGQFIINITMPITLYLIYKIYPNNPGFSFGLAASALWPGALIGNILKIYINNLENINPLFIKLFIFICFSIGILSICITYKKLKQ